MLFNWKILFKKFVKIKCNENMNENLQIRKKNLLSLRLIFSGLYLYCTVHYCTRNKKTVSFSLKFEYFKGMFEKWNAYPFSVNFLPILLVLVAPRWNLPGSAWSITDYCNVQCTVLLITVLMAYYWTYYLILYYLLLLL